MKDKKITLSLTSTTKQVIKEYGLDPNRMKFWREGYTAKASYRVGLIRSVEASADIEEYSSNTMLMAELCEEIIGKMK